MLPKGLNQKTKTKLLNATVRERAAVNRFAHRLHAQPRPEINRLAHGLHAKPRTEDYRFAQRLQIKPRPEMNRVAQGVHAQTESAGVCYGRRPEARNYEQRLEPSHRVVHFGKRVDFNASHSN